MRFWGAQGKLCLPLAGFAMLFRTVVFQMQRLLHAATRQVALPSAHRYGHATTPNTAVEYFE